jgi:ABC-type enterochelin transport system permease subunit
MIMELRHLRYFVAVAEECNFTRAAKRLHIAQPPLSRQIQQLEETLRVQLFERDARPLKLTDAGRFFYSHAVQVLAQTAELESMTKRIGKIERSLSVGFVGSTLYGKLPKWMLGSLAQTGWTELERLALPLIAGTMLLCASSRVLDALMLADDEARSLGVPVAAVRLALIAVATLISALTVSLAGMIGWVGLLVPHIARAIVGASNQRVLALSALLGATGLVLADTCARSLSAGEIPLGIVTELVGALVFIVVLRRIRHSGI